jgi:hypothetical protein
MKQGPNLKQRSRGRNNNGGGKKHMPSRNQTYDSNGPDIRIRGNAHQVLEKYLTMARDAASQGDRIAAENYYQHAEHYFRVINSQNQANGRPPDRQMPTPADDHMTMSGDLDGDESEENSEEDEASEERAEVQAVAPVVEATVEATVVSVAAAPVAVEAPAAAERPERSERPRGRPRKEQKVEEPSEIADA